MLNLLNAMVRLVPSIVAALIALFAIATFAHLSNRPLGEDGKVVKVPFLSEVDLFGWITAVVAAAIYWITVFLASSWPFWLGLILYLLMLAAIVLLIIRWSKKGYGLGELICFIIIAVIFAFAAWSKAPLVAGLFNSAWVLNFARVLAWAFLVLAVGWSLVDTVLYYRDEGVNKRFTDEEKQQKQKKVAHILSWVLRILFTLGLVALLLVAILGGLPKNHSANAPSKSVTETAAPKETASLKVAEAPKATETPAKTEAPAETETPVEAETGEFVLTNSDWYNLRHWAVLGGDKLDDDDFGPNPLDEILQAKVARGELTIKEISGKTEKELYGLITAEEIFDKFVEELEVDPVKGAGVMGYYDAVRGTNFLGKFSTELLEHPDALMELINAKAREWLADEAEYRKVLTAFVATLQRSDEIEITYAENGLDDQMYMFGTTPDHIPIVVVMQSTNHDGWFLTFRDYIKGTEKKEVSYRINCDFQPTNVSKVAKVTVKPNPNNPPATGGGGGSSGGGGTTGGGGSGQTGGGSSGGGGTTGGGGSSGGGGYIPPATNKDPAQGYHPATPIENKGGGPGPNTNNGVGATESKAEEPTNSIHEEIGEYWEDVKELKEPQAEAGDSNQPSTPTPSGADVDSNADKGTGNGGADDGSAKAPPVTYEDPQTGKDKSFANEAAGEEWELGS